MFLSPIFQSTKLLGGGNWSILNYLRLQSPLFKLFQTLLNLLISCCNFKLSTRQKPTLSVFVSFVTNDYWHRAHSDAPAAGEKSHSSTFQTLEKYKKKKDSQVRLAGAVEQRRCAEITGLGRTLIPRLSFTLSFFWFDRNAALAKKTVMESMLLELMFSRPRMR